MRQLATSSSLTASAKQASSNLKKPMDPVNKIGMGEYINSVLVRNDVRPAFLIQSNDYGESHTSDPISARKIKGIKEYFPDLIVSLIGQAQALIGKRHYTEADITSDEDMGRIIGYHCASDYAYVTKWRSTKPAVVFSITVNLHTGDPLRVYVNVCRDESTFEQSKELAKAAELVLKSDPLVSNLIDSVKATQTMRIPPLFLLNKLVKNKVLTETEVGELRSYIWNLGLNEHHDYEFDNPIHRGILISLMTYYLHNPLEPFYPLQYHSEHDDVEGIIKNWDDELRNVLHET